MKMNYILLLCIAISVAGCNRISPEKTITVHFTFPDSEFDTVSIFQLHPIDYSKINTRELLLDSLGEGSSELIWENPGFATMEIEKNRFLVLFREGFDLTIKGNAHDLLNTIEFEGRGAISNNYRVGINRLKNKFNNLNGTYLWQLDSAAFIDRINALNAEVTDYSNTYFQNHLISEELQQLLRKESMLISKTYALNYMLVKRIPLDDEFTNIPFDTTLLQLGSSEYNGALGFYLSSRISGRFWYESGADQNDSIAYVFPDLLYQKIRSLNTLEPIEELLIAKSLYEYFAVGIVSPITEMVYNQWKEAYPDSRYTQALENKLQQIQVLESGIPAPEITGVTLNGDSLSLRSLSGNIVYIDVWATWCGPCIEAMAFSKILENEFDKYDEVTFLYVSVDKDIDKWKKKVSDMNLHGIHINSFGGSLKKEYMIAGIPRYILIDQAGNVVSANAPEPSSGELKELIHKLIEQGS